MELVSYILAIIWKPRSAIRNTRLSQQTHMHTCDICVYVTVCVCTHTHFIQFRQHGVAKTGNWWSKQTYRAKQTVFRIHWTCCVAWIVPAYAFVWYQDLWGKWHWRLLWIFTFLRNILMNRSYNFHSNTPLIRLVEYAYSELPITHVTVVWNY